MRYYIGIDDTDNKESRGTGYRARKLAGLIEKENLGTMLCISRHQLFVDDRIPYTSQNSSACLIIESDDIDRLKFFSRKFMIEDSADGSDVGLCITEEQFIDEDLIKYGYSAKDTVLNKNIAYNLAESKGIYLEGLTGTKDGVIGALASLGLRKSGNDGRCISVKGEDIREIKGIFSVEDLLNKVDIDQIIDLNSNDIVKHSTIFIDNWLRPVIRNNKITIIANRENHKDYEWKIATKDYIKSISN